NLRFDALVFGGDWKQDLHFGFGFDRNAPLLPAPHPCLADNLLNIEYFVGLEGDKAPAQEFERLLPPVTVGLKSVHDRDEPPPVPYSRCCNPITNTIGETELQPIGGN